MSTNSTPLKKISALLFPLYKDLADSYAWWILEYVCNKKKSAIFLENYDLTFHEKQKVNEIIHLLVEEKKPLAYIIEKIPFANLELYVEPPTLIPRVETEEWVLFLIELFKEQSEKKLTILDIGTGSGCIALSLAKAFPYSDVLAIDISEKALLLAEKNAKHNNINNVVFKKSNLFEQITPAFQFDFIVSNPPYIEPNIWQQLDDTVKKWEDPYALLSFPTGISCIASIVLQSEKYLRKSIDRLPSIFIEIGYDQSDATKKLLHDNKFSDIHCRKDYFGNDRLVYAYR